MSIKKEVFDAIPSSEDIQKGITDFLRATFSNKEAYSKKELIEGCHLGYGGKNHLTKKDFDDAIEKLVTRGNIERRGDYYFLVVPYGHEQMLKDGERWQ